MFIGIDLGTSSIKIALIDYSDIVIECVSRSIITEHPKTGYSEQNPDIWFSALVDAFDELSLKSED